MKLNAYPAPHIRHNENTRVVMGNVILVLLILYAMAVFYHGARAAALGLWSAGICAVTDVLCTVAGRKRVNHRDFSAVVTGLILPLLMPATVPYRVVAVAAVTAIAAAKHPFGGVGHNVFNPAAAGFSFAAICFRDALFTYTLPVQRLPVLGAPAGELILGVSPAYTLSLGAIPQYEAADMALGNFPGPMGATNILVILACLLFLIFRSTVHWVTPVSFLAAAALFAFAFPRAELSALAAVGADPVTGEILPAFLAPVWGRIQSVLFELMSGTLLFGGVFMLGDPVTTPKRSLSRLVFGVLSGTVVMLFRYFGNLEEGFTFAVLLMNATVWALDMLSEQVYSKLRRRRVEVFNSQKVQKKA